MMARKPDTPDAGLVFTSRRCAVLEICRWYLPHAEVKYWEIIADRLHAEGWSYGIAEHLTKRGLLFASMRTAMETIHR
jgi:hypothetical protein